MGVAFPVVEGRRSTLSTGRSVFADAARAVDPGFATAIEAEGDWRRNYPRHVRRLVEAAARRADAALAIASAGLGSLHRRFTFVRGGRSLPLAQALGTAAPASPFETVTVVGDGTDRERSLSVLYRGLDLRGDKLRRQLDDWVARGVVEPSFSQAVGEVAAHPDWLDLSDRRLVVLGAAAELGPLRPLCRWGANVVAVDLALPPLWERVLAVAGRGGGRVEVPVRAGRSGAAGNAELTGIAGGDLLTETPELAAWLATFDGPLTLANYAYADGAVHVRLSMAADALALHLLAQRSDLSLASLASATEAYAVPKEVVAHARRRFADRGRLGMAQDLSSRLSRARLFAPSYPDLVATDDGSRVGIADGLLVQQGPNYALAKQLQRWRADVARHQGVLTSVNVAPPTATRSVLRRRLLEAAYAGASRVGVEVFDPLTSSTLMAALLVHDLRNPSAPAHPGTPLAHQRELYVQGANHGGLWRSPFAPRSLLPMAVVLGLVPRRPGGRRRGPVARGRARTPPS